MASVINRPGGHRWIQFVDPDSKRQTIRLGKMPKKAAETVCSRVEELLAVKMAGATIDRDLAGWLASIDDTLRSKLAAVGLCEARESALLGLFIAKYVEGRTDVKPSTKEVWRQGETGLIDFFGRDKPLRDVSPGDADRYKLHLIGKKLAPMTVRKRLQFATMIFRAAMRQRLIADNPFADVSVKASMPNRERFITADEAAKVLEACPNIDWRAIVVLARYGGLRCPSEVLSLRWQDIDWDAGRIVVTSPKTEHHPGKGTRTIPLFPELRPILAEAFELAPEGAVYVVDERMRKSSQGKAGWRNCNLRTPFERIIKRAGLTPWPRLFHNLRSSRQTELAEQFPSHVVCDWLGNSEDIARTHYLQTTSEHFARALNDSGNALQNPKQKPTKRIDGNAEPQKEKAPNKAKQNAKQLGAVLCRGEVPNVRKHAQNDTLRNAATVKTDGEGFEPPVRFEPHSGFQDRRLRPLGHPSNAGLRLSLLCAAARRRE